MNRLVIYIILVIMIPLLTFGATYKIKTINKTGIVSITTGVGYYVPVMNWVYDAFRGGFAFNIGAGVGVSSHFGFFGALDYIRLRGTKTLEKNIGTGRIRMWSIKSGMRLTVITAGERSPFGEVALGYSWMKVGGMIGESNQKLWFLDIRGGYELFVDKTKSLELSSGLIYYLGHPDFTGVNIPQIEGERKAAIIPLRFNFNFYF
ncbi:MAG: hypothetical protein ACUVWP_06035 [bacterium]